MLVMDEVSSCTISSFCRQAFVCRVPGQLSS
ncbi:BnaC04g51680D [Brassica napus]|uniref:BnaC04g51680D protein n=1 Tax=Brassica napus TaxID=3708 RepID=A0A078GQW1_BRANA|nr:BnaC04g51680D [Brassica napus]